MTPYPDAMILYPTVRQSLLSSFDLCALQTKFDQDYRAAWTSYPAARGQMFHRVAAKCLEEMAAHDNERIEADVALAILMECLRMDDVDRECPTCHGPVKRHTRDDGALRITCEEGHDHSSDFVNLPTKERQDLFWVVRKWALDNRWDIKNLVSVEERLHSAIVYPDGEGGHVDRTITGALDALFMEGNEDEHAIVVDYKDTWMLPPPTELSFEGYFQQRHYALLVMDRFRSVKKVTTREQYVRRSPGEPSEPGYPLNVREATIWREDLEKVREEIATIVERFDRSVQEDAWAPSPGKHCGYCSRPQACPIPSFVKGEGRIRTEDEAKKVAAQLLVSEVVMKQTKASLAAWSDLTGPIPIKNAKGDRVYAHREYERVERPKKEDVEAEVEIARLEGRDVDPQRLFKTRKGTKFEQFTPTPEQKPSAQDAKLLAALEESLRQVQKP